MWRYEEADDPEYLGNIWGWKFSIFGAVLLFGLIGLAFLQANRRGTTVWEAMREAPAPPADTTAPRPGDRPTPTGLLEGGAFRAEPE